MESGPFCGPLFHAPNTAFGGVEFRKWAVEKNVEGWDGTLSIALQVIDRAHSRVSISGLLHSFD
jgi:hypothetical protein